MKVLREHQTAAIGMLRGSLKLGRKRPVLKLPTGSGKTLIAAKIIESAREKGKRVLFIVDAIELIDQTVSAFYDEGLHGIGVVQAQHPMTDYSKAIQIASVQTLARRKIPEFDLAIVDECHAIYETVRKLMADNPEKPFIGLSATPWSRGMGLMYDDLVQPATIRQLTDLGYVAKLRAYAPAHPDLKDVSVRAGDFDEGQLSKVMRGEKLVADIVSTWRQLGDDRPTFCFCVDLAHAEMMRDRFEQAGIPAGYIDGKTPTLDRKAVKRRLDAGEIRVVCSVGTMIKGVDWVVGCIIDAQPTRSLMRHVQKLGRMRPNPQWEYAIVLDHSDNLLRLGLPIDINREKLDTTQKGEKTPPEAESTRTPKECPQCHKLAPKVDRRCSACGYEGKQFSEITEGTGRLAEVNGLRQGPKNEGPTHDQKQRFYGELLGYAEKAGKAEGWVAHQFKARFREWPKDFFKYALPPSPETQAFIRARNIRWAKGQEKRKAAA